MNKAKLTLIILMSTTSVAFAGIDDLIPPLPIPNTAPAAPVVNDTLTWKTDIEAYAQAVKSFDLNPSASCESCWTTRMQKAHQFLDYTKNLKTLTANERSQLHAKLAAAVKTLRMSMDALDKGTIQPTDDVLHQMILLTDRYSLMDPSPDAMEAFSAYYDAHKALMEKALNSAPDIIRRHIQARMSEIDGAPGNDIRKSTAIQKAADTIRAPQSTGGGVPGQN